MSYDACEQEALLAVFIEMLRVPTKDGGKKRAAGQKAPWHNDGEHEDAMYRHLNAWQHGEQHDPDNGDHPLIGLAWRALAVAAIESGRV